MDMVVRFKHEAFRRGVNEVLTLKPLREIVKDVLKDGTHHGKNVVVKSRDSRHTSDVSHGKSTDKR